MLSSRQVMTTREVVNTLNTAYKVLRYNADIIYEVPHEQLQRLMHNITYLRSCGIKVTLDTRYKKFVYIKVTQQ